MSKAAGKGAALLVAEGKYTPNHAENQERFQEIVTKFVNSIMSSSSKPPQHTQALLWEMASAMCKYNKPTPKSEASAMSLVVSRFYFRFVCASIVTPDSSNLIENQVTALQRKVLTHISKVVNSIINGVRKDDLTEPFNDLIASLASHKTKVYPFLDPKQLDEGKSKNEAPDEEQPKANEEQPKANDEETPKVSGLLCKASRTKVLADLRTEWPSLIAKVDSTFTSSTRHSLQSQISVVQGILFPSRRLLCPPTEAVLFSTKLEMGEPKKRPSLVLTDSFLYFYPYRSYSFHQAFRFKISSSSPAFILTPRCVTLEFAVESVEEPKISLEPYELDKTSPMQLRFRSLDERDSFKNLLGLACGMSRIKEESGAMNRKTEVSEEEETRLAAKVARQEKEKVNLVSQKDELINEFRNLSKEHKAVKIKLAKQKPVSPN